MKTWLFSIVLYSFLSWFVSSEELTDSRIDADLPSHQVPLARVPLEKSTNLLEQLVGGGQQNDNLLNERLETRQNGSILKNEVMYKNNQLLDSNTSHVTSVDKQSVHNETQTTDKQSQSAIKSMSSTKHTSVLNNSQLHVGDVSANQSTLSGKESIMKIQDTNLMPISANQSASGRESVTKNRETKETNLMPALNEAMKTDNKQRTNVLNTELKPNNLSSMNHVVEGSRQGTPAANIQINKQGKDNVISTTNDFLKQQNLGTSTLHSQPFKQSLDLIPNQLTKALNKGEINEQTLQPILNKIQSSVSTQNGKTQSREYFNSEPSTTIQQRTSFTPEWTDRMNFLTTKSIKNILIGTGLPSTTTLYSRFVTSTKPEDAAADDGNYLMKWDGDQDQATDNDKDLLIDDEDQDHVHDDDNIDLDVDDNNLNIDGDQDQWEGDNNIHLNVDDTQDGDDQLWEENGNGIDDLDNKDDNLEEEQDNDDNDDFNSIADKTGDFWDEPHVNRNPFIKDKFVTKNFKSPFAEEMRMIGFYSWVLFVTVLLLICFVFFTQQRHRCGLLYGYRHRYRTPSVSVEEGKDLMKNMYS